MPRSTRELVVSAVQGLAADPTDVANVEELTGRPGYRLRVDGWRVIWALDGERLAILVLNMGARGGVLQMSNVQVIEQGGKPVFYVVPAALWEKINREAEDIDDVTAFDRAMASGDGLLRFPAAVAHAMAEGVHAVRAWREFRGMTQDALAMAARVSKSFISQIEGGKREGSVRTLKQLAGALGIGVEALT